MKRNELNWQCEHLSDVVLSDIELSIEKCFKIYQIDLPLYLELHRIENY